MGRRRAPRSVAAGPRLGALALSALAIAVLLPATLAVFAAGAGAAAPSALGLAFGAAPGGPAPAALALHPAGGLVLAAPPAPVDARGPRICGSAGPLATDAAAGSDAAAAPRTLRL